MGKEGGESRRIWTLLGGEGKEFGVWGETVGCSFYMPGLLHAANVQFLWRSEVPQTLLHTHCYM